MTVYRPAQIEMDGEYALIDVEAEAHNLPFASNSQQYIISSHVFEHLPNPIQALVEARRVLVNGGIWFAIIPLRNALEADRSRALSTFEEVWAAYEAKVTVDTWDYTAKPVPGGRRGHYFVYTPELVKQMVEAVDGDWWELVAEEAVDTKVGNGFTLAFKLDKPEKGDPRLYVADDEQERFDTKHDAEIGADGGEVAKIGEEDSYPVPKGPAPLLEKLIEEFGEDGLAAMTASVVAAENANEPFQAEIDALKVFSMEDRTVETVKPEDGTLHMEDFAGVGTFTLGGVDFPVSGAEFVPADESPTLLHKGDSVISREQADALNAGLNALGGLATPGAITGTVTGNRKPAAKKRSTKKKS